MKLNLTLTAKAAALGAAMSFGPRSVHAQNIDEMRAEMKKMREELNEPKKARAAEAKPADSSGWGDRIEALEIKSKDAVVAGDIGGGLRIPGSETSLRIYGYAERSRPTSMPTARTTVTACGCATPMASTAAG